MFSQNLSFGMMLQSAMELQQKYQQCLPNDFPIIPQKFRHYQNGLDGNSMIKSTFRSTVMSQKDLNHNGIQDSNESQQYDEQVTFNENDEKSQFMMGTQDNTEDIINKLKQQIMNKDTMIAALQKQVQKNLGLENIQYKYDLQNKRLLDMQNVIRDRDTKIEQLALQLKQLENSTKTSMELNTSVPHQQSIRPASTPRPLLASSQFTSNANNTLISTPTSQNHGENNNNNKDFGFKINNKNQNTLVFNSIVGTKNKQKNLDMPLQSQRYAANSLKESLVDNQLSTSLIQSNHISTQNNNNNDCHLMMRCSTQAEMIEQLLKERESLKSQQSQTINTNTNNITATTNNKQTQDLQNLETQMKDILSKIYNMLDVSQEEQNNNMQFQDRQQLFNLISNNLEKVAQKIQTIQHQTKFSQLVDRESIITGNNKQNEQNMMFQSILQDQSIQQVNNISNLQSPKLKIKTKNTAIRQKSKNNRNEEGIKDDEYHQKLNALQKDNKELKSLLKSETFKTLKLQEAFKQIESIFRQEQNSSMDQDSNDKYILEQIQTLNHQHISELVKLKKQNEQLQESIESLNDQLQKLQQQNNQQQYKQDNSATSQKQGGSNNQFKRNTAIKKVQGFFQSQFNQNIAQQSVASLVYSDSSCSTNDLLFKSPRNNQSSTKDMLLLSTNQSDNNIQLNFLNSNVTSNKDLISDTGLIIMNNQTVQYKQQQNEIQQLNEKLSVLQQEKSLLDLEYKQQIEKLQNEIAELNIIKESYDEEKQQNIELQQELEKKEKLILELKQKLKKFENEISNTQEDYSQLVSKYDNQVKVLKNMQDSQLELKSLIEEERKAYNDDREKYEIDIQQIQQTNETKQKLLKTKLIALFDGPLEEAKQLQIDDLIDNIANRLNLGHKISANMISNNRRVASCQNNRRQQNMYNNETTLDQLDNVGGQDNNNRYDSQSSKKVMTSHELHKKFSCVKPQTQNKHMIINENDTNSRDQIFNMLTSRTQNANNTSLINKTNLFGQDQMTKIIELCQVQSNTPDIQVDFIQSNISPIKKSNNNDNDHLLYTQNTFDNGESTKENRIISADLYKANKENKQQIMQQQQQQNSKQQSGQPKHQSFIKTNYNHQTMSYPMKQQQPRVNQSDQDKILSERRRGLHLPSYDMPLQIKPFSITPQFSQNQPQHQQVTTNTAQQQYNTLSQQSNRPQYAATVVPTPVNKQQQCFDSNTIQSPEQQQQIFKTFCDSSTNNNNNQHLQQQSNTNTITVNTACTTERQSSSLNRNENLTSIIENFRREKSVFNQKFQELKQKLETFSSPSKTQREPSLNQRILQQQQAQYGIKSQRDNNNVTNTTSCNALEQNVTKYQQQQSSQQNGNNNNQVSSQQLQQKPQQQHQNLRYQSESDNQQQHQQQQQYTRQQLQQFKQAMVEPSEYQHQHNIPTDLNKTTPVSKRKIRTGYE